MAVLQGIDITKTYMLGEIPLEVLKGVSFSIDKGEFVGLSGTSGSGKSTLMNIIGCLDYPTTGTYLFEDRDISQCTPDELAHIRNKKVGFVFQQFNLISTLTAVDNVALPQLYAGANEKEARENAVKLLTQFGLGGRIHHYPHQLSGGEQQRTAIARALINNPLIILADEPTGNLDSKTGQEIMDTFKKLNQDEGKTIVLITHDPAIAKQSKRIISIKDGLIVK